MFICCIQTFLFLCIVIIIWSYFAILIQSSGFPAFEPQSHNVYYKKDQLMKFARVYNVLVLLWVIEFIIACQHMVIAGSVATWFFTRNKDNLSSPISTSLSNLFNYHLGSIALGSFIITILQIIRAILNYIDETLKESQNEVARSLYSAFKCVFSCLQQFLQYLTRNAYIEIGKKYLFLYKNISGTDIVKFCLHTTESQCDSYFEFYDTVLIYNYKTYI